MALVSAFDHGLVVGDGVFETLRVYDGTPFAVRRHLDRLAASARGLEMVVPPRPLLERALREGVDAKPGSGAAGVASGGVDPHRRRRDRAAARPPTGVPGGDLTVAAQRAGRARRPQD